MNSKIKKIMLLTTGLAGGLLATSIAGITLSSCTFQVQQDPNNNNNNNNQGNTGSTNQGTTTSPKDELTYNPNANYYTTQIIFDASGNITNASANTLTIKDGLIFADPAMTTLIGIMPSMQQSTITIPATVKAITGYQAAVVYDNTSHQIVNPTFDSTNGVVVGAGQTLLPLNGVGAFQKVAVTDGSNTRVTNPSIAATGLSTLTTINFANNSQLQTIGPKAFAGCNNLTTVNLPNATNTIGAQAFQNCTNLQTINLKGVSYIGDAAFNNAFIAQNDALATENPVSLDLTSAQYIGVGAFDSSVWTSTTNRAIGDQVLPGTQQATETKNLSKISAISFAKPLTTLSDYAFNGANYLLKSIDLSSCTSLASIGNNAFSNTTNLADVKFSPTIGNIGNRAFSGAKLTNTLTFNTNTDLTIGQNAFDTQQLTTIDFSNVKGNITIGNSAFSGSNQNTSLTTLTLPAVTDNAPIKQIVMIGESAFGNCTELKLPGLTDANAATYSLPANIGYVGNNAFSAKTLDAIKGGLTYAPNFTVTNELTNVANGLFAGITNGSTYFGPLAGNNNTSLTSVDLSNTNIEALNYGNVSDLGLTSASTIQGTFNGASNLKEITLPASCNQFGIAAFSHGNTYPTQYGAFSNCTSLQNLNFKNFKLKTTSGDDANPTPIAAGFAQITQDTWVQVANIMNALMYFGQQKIEANSDVENSTITNQTQMDAITYTVSADPVATKGTWAANNNGSNSAFNQFGQHMDTVLGPTIIGYNYPINVYPAGNYGYSVEAPASGGVPGGRVGETIVNYPAGLGTSVSANFKGSESNPSLSVQMSNGSGLGFGNNGPLMNGSGTDADTNVVFNTAVANANSIVTGSTITLTENSTRPQSVWYTVSASGTVGATAAGTTTQKLYDLTPDENNNIFAINKDKIAGATNSGVGGYGYGMGRGDTNTSLSGGKTYTTVVSGQNLVNDTEFGNPFAEPNKGSLVTDNGTPTITLSQNYLPLGITANVKDAYFNHNGIIWHYHNGFIAGDTNNGIYIEGKVNAYIGGSIQAQGNGIGGLADGVVVTGDIGTNGTGNSVLTNDTSLAAGVYKNGAGLTSVDNTGQHVTKPEPNNTVNNPNPTINLFGGKVTTGNVASSASYNYSVGPANVQVKLTLVPASTPSTSGNK